MYNSYRLKLNFESGRYIGLEGFFSLQYLR